MDIRLVTTSFNDEVHGTFNEKKTGCGINLLKSENVTRYHRGGIMRDLGEITCEKCKTKIAKEMIKSDQKEMKLLLKEEKLRAKKGIVDDGIVPLAGEAKITKDQTQKPAPAPKPVYQKPEPAAPAQPANIGATIPGTGVAIDNSLAQFAINKPQAEPAPEAAPQDNFLDQFAINKPQAEPEPAPAPVQQDDFLAQFAINAPAQTEPEPVQEAPAPSVPPVIDDISAAIAAMNSSPAAAPQPAAEPVQQAPTPAPAPAAQADDILSMFSIEAPEKPVAGTYDNDSSVIDVAEESLSSVEPEPVQQATAPVIDDISAAVEAAQNNIPKYEAPVQPAAAPEPVQQASSPAQEKSNVSEWDLIANQLFGANGESPQNAPKAEPVQQATAPVIDDISAAVDAVAQNAARTVAPAAASSKPVSVKPTPVKPAAPAPAPAPAVQQTAAPAGMPAMGQVISVPQITGYDAAKQPIYTYVQMQITGYGENGQPVLSPVPGQEIPEFEMPFNKNTRLQEAIRAAQEIPTSAHEMTPGQRIAAAEAAKGSPISANVSKIATNQHTKATSQAFINAISESKEYANQSLTDTQGLQQRTRVIGSIEDVLSQLGDNSLQQKKAVDAKVQQSIPAFQEYKAPARSTSMSSAPAYRPTPRPSAPTDERFLSKAELKALKKQEKIDAKFRKEMAKRRG